MHLLKYYFVNLPGFKTAVVCIVGETETRRVACWK